MAYAAVISLKRTIETLVNPTNSPILKSASEELKLFEDIFDRLDGSSSNFNRGVINLLDAEIRDAVWKLEDVLQFHALHHSLPPSDGVGAVHTAEEGVDQEIDSILMTVKKLRERYNRALDNPSLGEEDAVVPPMDDVGVVKSKMVGLTDQLEIIRDQLLDWEAKLKTIYLFGMAGIGKTHLAREIYQLLKKEKRFDLLLWVALGPKYNIDNVLMDIADQMKHVLGNLYVRDDNTGVAIHKNLCGRKYFIILDDIWSTEDWYKLKMWFPAEETRSRVLVTTRLEEVATCQTNASLHVQMRLLNNEESWNLLSQNVIGEERYPSQLEKAGRRIAEYCEGLPLLILKVAHLLSANWKTERYWNDVANNKTSIFTDAYSEISKVLLSSFDHLPQHLKACFLYIGAFPLNYEVPLPKLINLWAVEDIIESQTIEEFALECLEKLVSQSLLIVSKHSSNGRIKALKLHSTYWHLCVVEARKNKFLHVVDRFSDFDESIEGQRRLSVQNNVLFGLKEVVNDSMAAALTVRSLLCTGQYLQYPVPIFFDLMLLKVLDALSIRFYDFPDEVLKLLQLKYLALTHTGSLPSRISELQNLQSLIVRQHQNIKFRRDSICLPKEIWDMPELRHLRIKGSTMPDPSNNNAELPNLLTLHVNGQSCTEKVFRSIPKLKKLGITIELRPRSTETLSFFKHISILQELVSLKCVVLNPRLRSQVAPPDPFPKSLKKLSLNGLGYSWEYMSEIGSLPSLQVLKLRRSAFQGPEWETKSEEFPVLEFLLLEDIDLMNWTTEGDGCFPSLQSLIIRHCYKLEEIPPEIGEVSTLKRMEIFDCNRLVVASAHKIKEVDEEYNGECSFQVPVTSSWDI